MTFSERVLTAVVVAGCLQVGSGVAAAQSGCAIGISAVACPAAPIRTVVVAKSGTADYRNIQYALDAARPGDTILVRSGVYTEPAMLRVSGTPTAPVTLKAYPGESPVIQPYYEGRTATVALTASWLVLEGFEIRAGRHGVVISGANNLVKNNYIHDNGQGCPGELCGQGVIVSSTTDVALVGNRVERNGLTGSSPWHLHGIYISDYFGSPSSRVSVIGNTIRQHAGGGLHVWTSASMTNDVLALENTFENNVFDLILSTAQNVVVRGNTFTHVGGHPPTNAPQSAMIWLDSSRNVSFESNRFKYSLVSSYGVPTVPVRLYSTSQSLTELRWRKNTWDAPGTGLSDAAVNVNVAGAPRRPMISARQSAANPVVLEWSAGAGADPVDYTVIVGTTPGGSELGPIPMGSLSTLTGAAPVGQLFARVVGRNAAGAATSNEIRLRVAGTGPAPVVPAVPTPVMLAPTVTGTTVRLSWQQITGASGYTVVARYTAGGPVIATVPVAGAVGGVTITGVPRGTYVLTVVAQVGGATSAESATVIVTVL